MGKILNFLLGGVIGAAVGSAVIMMLTPSSGIELRDHLKDYVQNMQDEVEKARETRRSEMELQLERLRKPTI
jgi:gas vesicle protein